MSGELKDQLQVSLGSAYIIERELGGGGMSRVFVATEAALGRRVVIKVLPPDTAAQVSIDRFKREITVAAMLYDALGDRARGLEWLSRAVDQQIPLHNWARQWVFAGLRADPQGAKIFARTESWSDSIQRR